MTWWDRVLDWADRATEWRWFGWAWGLWALACGLAMWVWLGNGLYALCGVSIGAAMGADVKNMARAHKP